MRNKQIVVIVDSDALIAQSNLADAHHNNAVQISHKLESIGAKVIYPATAIFEATTLMHRWNQGGVDMTPLAAGTLAIMSDPSMIVEPVDQSTVQKAAKYYNPKASKKHTTFDSAVAAIAEKHKADYIFSWDKFYTAHGFKLAQELL